MWTSLRIELSDRSLAEKWRYDLTMNRVRDLIDPLTGEVWSEAKNRRFIQHSLEVEGEFVIGRSRPDTMGFRQRTLTPISHLLSQWAELRSCSAASAPRTLFFGTYPPGTLDVDPGCCPARPARWLIVPTLELFFHLPLGLMGGKIEGK